MLQSVCLGLIHIPDETLIRGLLSSHPNLAREALYLGTGTLPIKYIWAARRLSYLHTTLKRDKTELIRTVYDAQQIDTKQGHFVQLVQEDAKMANLTIGEEDKEQINQEEMQYFLVS